MKTFKYILLILIALGFLGTTVRATPITYGTTGTGGDISNLYTVDVATGTTTLIGSVGYAVNAIEYHDGTLYGFERLGGSLLEIDTSTGLGTPIGSLGTNLTSFAISASGEAYGWSESTDDLWSVDLTTGATTHIGPGYSSTATHGLAFKDGTLYFHNYNGNLYTVNTGTGALTSVGNTGLYRDAIDGDVNPDDGLYYGVSVVGFTGVRTITSIDLLTASVVGVVSTDPVELHTLAFAESSAPIPEPATMLLFGTGLIGLAGARRKFKK